MGIGMLRKVDGEMESVREEGRGSEAGPLPGVGIAELSALRNVFDARCLCYKKREREKDAESGGNRLPMGIATRPRMARRPKRITALCLNAKS